MDDKTAHYTEEDLVYIDPETRTVMGKVEFVKHHPKSKPYRTDNSIDEKSAKKKRGRGHRKFYPWGTFKSMRKIYKLEGYSKAPEPNRTLDEVLPRALENLF